MTPSPETMLALACPCCGADGDDVALGTFSSVNEKGSAARCKKCGMHGPLKSWNTRLAASRPAPVDREAVARAVADRPWEEDYPHGSMGAFNAKDRKERDLAKADRILSLLRPAEPVEAATPCEELYCHKKRGTTYRILHGDEYGTCYASSSTVAQIDHEPMVVYQDVADGKVWVRPRVEFFDGRFEKLPRAAKPTTPDAVGEPVTPSVENLITQIAAVSACVAVVENPTSHVKMLANINNLAVQACKAIAEQKATHPPASPDTSAAVLQERERCARVKVSLYGIGGRSNDYLQGFEDACRAYIEAIRQLPIGTGTERGE